MPAPPHCSAGLTNNRRPWQPNAHSMRQPQPPSKTLWRNSSRSATARSNCCVEAGSARYPAPAGLAGGSVIVGPPLRGARQRQGTAALVLHVPVAIRKARRLARPMRCGQQCASNSSSRSGAPPTGRRPKLSPARNPVRHRRAHDRPLRAARACPACAGFRRRTGRHRPQRAR